MTAFQERIAQKRAALVAKREAQLRSFGDPKPQDKVVAETVVEGKTVREWAKDIDTKVEEAEDAAREQNSRALVVIDMRSAWPSAAASAVRRWKAAGCPTEADETLRAIQALRDEAEKYLKFVGLENDRVRDAKKAGDDKKAEQHARYAETSKAKAEKLTAEADAIVKDWKEKHP